MEEKRARPGTPRAKREYVAPELVEHGTIEKITGWVGGPWGEFLGGEGSGWNPWDGGPNAS